MPRSLGEAAVCGIGVSDRLRVSELLNSTNREAVVPTVVVLRNDISTVEEQVEAVVSRGERRGPVEAECAYVAE